MLLIKKKFELKVPLERQRRAYMIRESITGSNPKRIFTPVCGLDSILDVNEFDLKRDLFLNYTRDNDNIQYRS